MFSSFFKNKITYEIDVDLKIVFLRFLGEVSTGNVIKIHKKIINDPNYFTGFNWIIDIRKSKQLFTPNHVESFFSFFKDHARLFQNIKMVFIIDSKKQSLIIDALINLFKINDINIEIKKEVNQKTAFDWIKIKYC